MSRKTWVKLWKTSGSWDTAPFLWMLENKIFFQFGDFVILVDALFAVFHFILKIKILTNVKVYGIKIGIFVKFL